jgi:hypothetical protein
MCASAEVRVKAVERNVETLDFSNAEAAKGATRYLCSAKRRCIVYVVMFCASRDRESWQGVASLRRRSKHIYANICAMCRCRHFAVSLHKSPVAPELLPPAALLNSNCGDCGII